MARVRVMNLVRYITLSFVLLTLASRPVRTQGAYEYVDDFSSQKAQSDCSQSSLFWPSDINSPPPCPYLFYRGAGDARGLVFMDYRGDLAQLGYSFRLGPKPTGTSVRGTLQVDVSFPCDGEISQFPEGRLSCKTSPDGLTWSTAQSLHAGHNEILIQSASGACYMLFSGTRVVIDNVHVSLSAAASLHAPESYGTALTVAGAVPSILHVDWLFGRDGNTGRSRTSAFATVQKAIDTARNGDIVVVWPGVYQEEIIFKGKAITVQSAAEAAVITAPSGYAFSFYKAEGPKSILANFVIAGCGEGAIFCDNGAKPTLRNLTITGNQIGINVYGGANPYLVNCIIWQNANGQLSAWKDNFDWQIYYSCVGPDTQNNLKKAQGNINADPRLADPALGNYHIESQWGRYVPLTGTWVLDSVTSPCLDAGDPAESARAEPMSSGSRINMGAYGGTPFASRSSGPVCN